jgi:predicted nucleic acid-binding protein
LKWLNHDLRAFFVGRVLEVTEDVVHSALVITEPSLRKRQAVHLADCLIAATARLHELCIVTRNAKDFLPFKVMVLNPWTDERFNEA